MRHSYFISVIFCIATLIAGCSGSPKEKSPVGVAAERTADLEVFKLGSEDAHKMLDKCQTITEIEQELLDVKARIHLINTRVGDDAARAYTEGFESYIRENNDSIARLIL